MEPITIMVVDDHPLFRQGVVGTLSLEPDFRVIAESADGEQAMHMLRALRPMIAIVDVNLPGLNGQQLTRQIVLEKLPIRVILLTAYDDDEQKAHALRMGASAYCSKDVRPEDLVRLIRKLALGSDLSRRDRSSPGQADLQKSAQTTWNQESYDKLEMEQPLSDREMEVLAQLTNGLSNKEIASTLGISHQTVKNHVTAILRKIGVEDRTQAAVFALRRGWVRLFRQDEEQK